MSPLDGEPFKGMDQRPSKRVKNPKAMKDKHKTGGVCALNCGNTPVSLHHVLPRSLGGGDAEPNLVFLCGSGTTGCHGKIENADMATLVLLGEHLLFERPDTIEYLKQELGEEGGLAWLARRLHVQP